MEIVSGSKLFQIGVWSCFSYRIARRDRANAGSEPSIGASNIALASM